MIWYSPSGEHHCFHLCVMATASILFKARIHCKYVIRCPRVNMLLPKSMTMLQMTCEAAAKSWLAIW